MRRDRTPMPRVPGDLRGPPSPRQARLRSVVAIANLEHALAGQGEHRLADGTRLVRPDAAGVRSPGSVLGAAGPLEDATAEPAGRGREGRLRGTRRGAGPRRDRRPLARRVPAPRDRRAVRAPRLARACTGARRRPSGRASSRRRDPRARRASASACIAAGVNASGPPAATRPSTRRTFVSTAPTGRPNAIAATARAVYGPTPGSVSRPSTVPGTRPRCSATIAIAARWRLSARRL